MREITFKDTLNNANVAMDAAKIVPALAKSKKRLEVDKIKAIVNRETDNNFDMTTDEDVYQSLKAMIPYDLRLVFKACVEALGDSCDVQALNRINKGRVLALFFHVFAVYPEAISTQGNTPDETTDADFDAEQFAEIFPDFSDAVEVDFAKVRNLLPEQSRNVTNQAELRASLDEDKIKQGQIVRDFIEATLATTGKEFNATALKALRREHYLPLFFRAVKFVNFGKTASTKTEPSEPVVASLTFEQMQALFDAAKKVFVDDDFDISDTLKIFEDNPVTVKDKFYLSVPDDRKIYYGLVAIATQDGEIAAIGHAEDGIIIERGTEKTYPHVVFDWQMIDKEKFLNRRTFLIVMVPAAAGEFFSRPMSQSLAESYGGELWTMEFNVEYHEPQTTDRPLCIDFGTSNTTAGTYDLTRGGRPEQVTFRDVTSEEIIFSEVLPTIVYVDSCHDGIVSYKHGYEAKQEIIAAGYNTKATVFYEIKRWLNSLDTQEEVTDGRETATVTRREILEDYLLYVIRAAEQQFQVKFKNLHLTAPVKLRKKFLNEMEKIFEPRGYVVDKNSLDEGLATVYHYIAKQIENVGDTSGKILILDCGGGTTDMASCHYQIEKGKDWHVLKLETDFESGDSNFGGNNITYRILQMLKMKIAANLERNENLQIYDLIPDEDDDILSLIDFDYANKATIYKSFEEEYSRVESFIPTKFAEYTMKNERIKVKRNFYYLWQLAEAIKIEFFKSNLVNVDFEKKKKIFVRSPEEYYLSVRKDGKLQPQGDPMDGVEITIREINRILLPDLYAILKTLLSHYAEDELMKYKYRLSGQSCKINKFRDLFKEFVPGKHMRIPRKRGSEDKTQVDSVVLKKYCILGSIEYVRDAKALGKYKAIIDSNRTRRIYAVKSLVGRDERTLLERDGSLNIRKFPIETGDTKFLVRGANNRIEREILYHFDKGDADNFTLAEVIKIMSDETTYTKAEIEKGIGEKLQEVELENYGGKLQPIFCIAALDANDGYGFNVYQIGVSVNDIGATEYWLPKKRHFESYEDENLQTFFNGDK